MIVLVFDVGANVGAKAQLFRSRGATVICFEPQPGCACSLRERFEKDHRVKVVETALGESPGFAKLKICSDAPTISTMSDRWIKGRFCNYTWDTEIIVKIETLDRVIDQFGLPDYCKIDVEGFEYEVLKALSRPVPLISFEFTKEFEDIAISCVEHLDAIGFRAFNVGYGETGRFRLTEWVSAQELITELPKNRHRLAWGDIYAGVQPPSKEVLAVVTGGLHLESDNDALGTLRRLGVSYPGVPLRLHLGCGEEIYDGYVNIDYPQHRHNLYRVAPDFETDITTMAFPSETVDEIRLHHVFEHFNRVVALGMLIRWHMWLRTGGQLMIETPDFLATANAALQQQGAGRVALVRHLEGDQAADWGYHVGQWYPERFERTLTALGFCDVRIEIASTEPWHIPPLHNVTAHATKNTAVPLDTLIASAEMLLSESMVSSAEVPTWKVWCQQLRRFLAAQETPGLPVAHRVISLHGAQ